MTADRKTDVSIPHPLGHLARLLVASATLAVSACGYDWPADNDRGGPGMVTPQLDAGAGAPDAPVDLRPDAPRPADAAPARGSDTPSGAGGGAGPGAGGAGAGAGGAGGGGSPTGTGGGPIDAAGASDTLTIDPVACKKCQVDNCPEELIENECQKLCLDDTTMMTTGPAMGRPHNELCQAVLSCYTGKSCMKKRDSGEYTSQECLCGAGKANCSTPGSATGACLDSIQNAGGTIDPAKIAESWNKPTVPLGCANFMAICNYQYCQAECLGIGKPATPPTTNPPTTNPPPTNPPTTNPPTTNPPATNPPNNDPPTTNPPATNPPTTNPATNGVCPDLDGNSRPDCQESLLSNGDFDATTDGWAAESDVGLKWEKVDGKDDAQSGALVVTNGSATMAARAATQCVKVEAAKTYRLMGQVFIKAGQGALRAGAIKIQYFDGETCAPAGAGSLGEHPFLEQGTGAWKLVDGLIVTPARSRSALVRLVAETEGGSPFEAKFDNLLFKAN